MEYTIKKLAQLSGVSSRTLRYYDQIQLLKPKRINSSGYRIYGAAEVDRLNQILYLKGFGMSLETIKATIDGSDFQITNSLEAQYQQLLAERSRLDAQIAYLQKNLAYYKGEIEMTDQEKFEQMKQQQLADNEARYGSEIREKYGEEAIEAGNQKWLNMSQADHDRLQAADQRMIAALDQLSQQDTVDLDSDLAKTVFEAHKEWLMIAAPFYNVDYHRGLADMYVADPRFAVNYDGRTTKPSVNILREIIWHYTAQ